MLFPPITITDSTPFTLHLATMQYLGRLKALEVAVDSPGDAVYYGDYVVELPVIIGEFTQLTGFTTTVIAKKGTPTQRGWNDVMPGYVFSCEGDDSDDGNFVVANEPNTVVMREAMTITPNENIFVFTPPPVASTNGIPIAAGTTKSFLADELNHHLDSGITFVVATGETAVIRLRYRFGR